MRCETCGQGNLASRRFCRSCGARLALICAACGQTSAPNAKYCGNCGDNLSAAASLQVAPSGSTPRGAHLAQTEIKQVTVLFSDLVSSTELVAQLDAEGAMQRLQPVLQMMCEAVGRFGGTVSSRLGDGIMAVFGAPRSLEGHAVLACHAALAIRDAVRLHGEGLSVRSGLHSGEVVADVPFGSPEDAFNAYGMTLHLASRLPSQVEPAGICITDASRKLLPAAYDVAPLGSRPLRGVPHPVALYALRGTRPAAVAGRSVSTVAAGPMVGREQEMGRLKKMLEEASENRKTRVVGVVGPPGTGKSRLSHEFAEFCRAHAVQVFEMRAQPYGMATPLQPVMEFFRSAWLRIDPIEPPLLAERAIQKHLAEIGASDQTDAALVCDFLGVPQPQELPAWLSAKARTARLIEILGASIRHRGASRSVIIIEDLHWLDEASEAFVAAVVQAVISTRFLLVVNFRPPYEQSWMRTPVYERIELADFSQSDTDALVGNLIGPDDGLADLRRRVAARSGGNPFFAEELVHALQGQGVVVGQRGAFKRGQAAGQGTLPATVQAVISARMDRLPAPARNLLQLAAIVGQTFSISILQAVTGQEARMLDQALGSLCDEGLLLRDDGADRTTLRFRHPLIQEVAYATQLKTRRASLHAAVAGALERLDSGRHGETAALIAHHFEEAGELRRAAFFAAHAARWLGPRNSTEATRYWHKVRLLLGKEPRSHEADQLRIEASGQIAWVGWREGLTPEQARPFVQEALQWARETDVSITPLLMLVEGRIAQVNGGSSDTFVRQIRNAIALAEGRNDAGRAATLQAGLSHAYGWAGLLRQALQANDAALAGIDEISDADHRFLGYSVRYWVVALRGRILVRLGRFEEARACLDATININDLIDPTVLFIGHLGYVDLAWCIDDAAMALRHAANIGDLADRHGSSYLRAYRRAASATAHGIAGDYDLAVRATLDGLDRLAQTRAAVELEPELLASLAEYRMRSGDLTEARKAAEGAIALAHQRDARLPACRARITLATLTAKSGGANASALLSQAERLIAETGATIYLPRLREARGGLGSRVRPAAGPERSA
jgi:class 3 adenylate cyclase/tetratricopeptide (TPR) repeat protein